MKDATSRVRTEDELSTSNCEAHGCLAVGRQTPSCRGGRRASECDRGWLCVQDSYNYPVPVPMSTPFPDPETLQDGRQLSRCMYMNCYFTLFDFHFAAKLFCSFVCYGAISVLIRLSIGIAGCV